MIYTVAELADRWKVSRVHVRKLIAKDIVQSFRVGGNVRITSAEVQRTEGAEYGDGEQRALAAIEELRRAVRH